MLCCRCHEMSLGSSWMSCRSTCRSHSSAVLPTFAISGAPEFALETRPPQLPPRNSTPRMLGIITIGFLCVCGALAMVSAAVEPVMNNGGALAQGVQTAIRNAITHANAEAERHAHDHYVARQEYLQRKGRAPSTDPYRRRLDDADDRPAYDLPLMKSQKSSLLLRMAAIRKIETTVNDIDEHAVRQYFPAWVDNGLDRGAWNENAVLRDLVLAVSQLAHRASVDAFEPREGQT